MELERFWINQPSTLQADHSLHGQRVLARKGYDGDRKDDKITRAYLLDGPVHSVNVFTIALSPGWPAISPPCFNDKGFSQPEKAYIDRTTQDLSTVLQRVGVAWPSHEIAATLSTHIHLLRGE